MPKYSRQQIEPVKKTASISLQNYQDPRNNIIKIKFKYITYHKEMERERIKP